MKTLLLLFALSLPGFAQDAPAPAPYTTTLTALRANTTSAADNFPGTFNGNAKPGNLSPLPLSTLLPGGDKTRYIAHLVPPWVKCSVPVGAAKCGSHPNVGYDQDSDAQIARQVADMRRRGFTVVWLDWFGPDNQHHNSVALRLLKEVERVRATGADFSLIIQPDHGIERDCAATGCDAKLIAALTYAYKTFEQSPAYLHWNGRPVVPFFWNDRLQPVDWVKVKQAIPGNPMFIFRDAKGFNIPGGDGAFAWNGTDLSYMTDFYKAGAAASKDKLVIGASYPGFDDRLASWGKNKIIPRRCGLNYLDTIRTALTYQKLTGSPVPFIQLVTWNDYDEGTVIEPGIDNCIAAIPAQVTGNTPDNKRLTWTVAFGKDKDGATGNEETIAYFRIFAATDHDNVKLLKDVPVTPAPHTLDLTPFDLKSGQKLYIQAIGRSMILNHLSDAITVP